MVPITQSGAISPTPVLRTGSLLLTDTTRDVTTWQSRLSALAGSAGDKGSPALSLEAPMESHRELQLCVKQAIADCGQLKAQEKASAESLDVLGEQTEAAKC